MAKTKATVTETKDYKISIESGKSRLYTWGEMLSQATTTEWIIENLITVGSVVTVFGQGGSKKTYAMIDMAVCFTLKKEWLGFRIPKNGKVLIIDEESGRDRLSLRYKEVVNGHKVKDELPIITSCLSGFDFRNSTDVSELQSIILQAGAKLVIIDTLMNVIPGGDDNSSKDINTLYQGLRKVADLARCAIIIIHHMNKGNGYRGSTAIQGGSDLMIQVNSKSTSPNIDFKTTKERDIAHTEWSAVAFLEKGNKFYLSSSIKKLTKLGATQEYILRSLATVENATIKSLEENSNGDCSPSSIRSAIYKMVDGGYIDTFKQGRQSLFSLTEMGNNYVEQYIPIDVSSYL